MGISQVKTESVDEENFDSSIENQDEEKQSEEIGEGSSRTADNSQISSQSVTNGDSFRESKRTRSHTVKKAQRKVPVKRSVPKNYRVDLQSVVEADWKCSLCNWKLENFANWRRNLSVHVWHHVFPIRDHRKDEKVFFFCCRLCKTFTRSITNHYSRTHETMKELTVGEHYEDFRPQFADEYHRIWALCFPSAPGDDDSCLGSYSMAEITQSTDLDAVSDPNSIAETETSNTAVKQTLKIKIEKNSHKAKALKKGRRHITMHPYVRRPNTTAVKTEPGKNGEISVVQLRCSCGWHKGPSQSRYTVSNHVFSHIPPREDRNLPLYRCLVCRKNKRLLPAHFLRVHKLPQSQLVENRHYLDLRANFACEYRKEWLQCYPGIDESILGNYSIEKLVNKKKKKTLKYIPNYEP